MKYIVAAAALVAVSASAQAGEQQVNGVSAVLPGTVKYHEPPEPVGAETRTHHMWERAVGARHLLSPVMRSSTMMHGPVKKRGPATRIAENMTTVTAQNWSGTSVVNGNINNLEAITTMFVVPIAQQAFGTCSPDKDWVGLWVGIDGSNGSNNPLGHNDLLQAGVTGAASCTASEYTAWVEWYPNPPVAVSSPVINPGDLVFVEVWSTSPTQGWATIYNYSTDLAAEYQVSAPSGVTLQGSSVEWILERPGVPPVTLTNYVASAWPAGEAWNYAASNPTVYRMGEMPAVGTLEQFTMLDNNGQPISSVAIENPDFLWFTNSGSSCGINLMPC